MRHCQAGVSQTYQIDEDDAQTIKTTATDSNLRQASVEFFWSAETLHHHPRPSQPSSNHSLHFLSVLDDADFLPIPHDTRARVGNSAAANFSSAAAADPFRADWPHWGSPAPCWLERCL